MIAIYIFLVFVNVICNTVMMKLFDLLKRNTQCSTSLSIAIGRQ